MNDVVFVMVNSRLNKKKEARKANNYNIEDVSSDDDWIVEENVQDENSDLPILDEDILDLTVPENVGVGGAPVDDLQIPIDDDVDEIVGGLGDDAINENEDDMKDEDDYPEIMLNSLL